jgi:hypothetical protein
MNGDHYAAGVGGGVAPVDHRDPGTGKNWVIMHLRYPRMWVAENRFLSEISVTDEWQFARHFASCAGAVAEMRRLGLSDGWIVAKRKK